MRCVCVEESLTGAVCVEVACSVKCACIVDRESGDSIC